MVKNAQDDDFLYYELILESSLKLSLKNLILKNHSGYLQMSS